MKKEEQAEIGNKKEKRNREVDKGKKDKLRREELSEEEVLDQEKKKISDEVKELTAHLQRVQAEFDNYRKRIEREREEYKKIAKKGMITKLIPIIDTLEMAITSIKNPNEKEAVLIKGMEMIYSQLITLLEEEGVRVINPTPGEKYDPKVSEAILTEKRTDLEKNTITEVLQKGYSIGDKILRPAKVKVNN